MIDCWFCFVQFSAVSSRHQSTAALLFLHGVRNPCLGPAHQQVCLCSGEPLQRSHIAGLFSRWPHSDQVHSEKSCHFNLMGIFRHVSPRLGRKKEKNICWDAFIHFHVFVFFFSASSSHVILENVPPLLKFNREFI